MYTIDASVHINAANTAEKGSKVSKAFIKYIRQQSLPVYLPTLLLVEVASSLARLTNKAERGADLAKTIRNFPGQTWVSLDQPLAEEAWRIGAVRRLRGADAVYAAVALRFKTTLVTLDRQQLERLGAVLPVKTPAQILQELSN